VRPVIIRIFRATAKPGKADELAELAEEVSIPFVDGQPGLLARHTGRGVGATGDEFIMVSVWESLDAMKNMTGEDWESEVLPDERLAALIAESSVDHYEAM
jgi:heme-degrading monooxygenase HmoA